MSFVSYWLLPLVGVWLSNKKKWQKMHKALVKLYSGGFATRTAAPTWTQLGSNIAQLGHGHAQLVLCGGIEPSSKPKKVVKTQVFSVSHWVVKLFRVRLKADPKGPQLGPKLRRTNWSPSWRELVNMLDWSWTQSNPDGHQEEAREVQVTKVVRLRALWRQLHTKLGPTEKQPGEHCFKRSAATWKTQVKFAFWRFRLCPSFWSHMDFNWGRNGLQVGAK